MLRRRAATTASARLCSTKWRNRYEELGEEAGEVHGLHVEVCSHVHEENYAFPC